MLFVHLKCHARMVVAVTLENGQEICSSKTKQTDGSTSRQEHLAERGFF